MGLNRETRRRARLFGGMWRGTPGDSVSLPRYVRRHYQEVVVMHPRTRRERRHRARILRAMADQT